MDEARDEALDVLRNWQVPIYMGSVEASLLEISSIPSWPYGCFADANLETDQNCIVDNENLYLPLPRIWPGFPFQPSIPKMDELGGFASVVVDATSNLG